jgi:hypothetical protein
MWPKFKTQAEIPEQFRSLYHEVGGEWVYKEPAPTDDGAELKETLEKERKARKEAEKALKDKEREQAQKDKDDERRKGGVKDEDLKKIRAEVADEVRAEYKPQLDRLAVLEKDNRGLRLDSKVKALMGSKEVGVRPERLDTLWRIIGEEFDLTDDGSPMVKAKPGTPVEKYLADAVKKAYPEFFLGTQAAGGGAAGAGGTGAGSPGPTSGVQVDVLANPGLALQTARAAGAKE